MCINTTMQTFSLNGNAETDSENVGCSSLSARNESCDIQGISLGVFGSSKVITLISVMYNIKLL